tara:strand:- start:135372 stop:135788 length:417 start_codon:yes stop_codon:yes gene_type:complete
MDAFARRYAIGLVVLALAAVIVWLVSQDSRVAQLNDMLRKDSRLANYPYQFTVLALDNGVASVTSPRSAEVSVIQALRIINPNLRNFGAVSPQMMSAQIELAGVQSHAAQLLQAQADVSSVRWKLDENWLAHHGVYID